MSERKILNLAQPILRTWSSESHLMSMILMQENSMDWIFNNYINLQGISDVKTDYYSLAFFPHHDPTNRRAALNAWTGCPFLEVHFVSHIYVKYRYINILEYIMYAIEEGYYLYFHLNQEQLKTRMNPQIHKTFVYGFDKSRKKIYVADHYNNSKYAFAEIEFDELLNAYKATYGEGENSCDLLKADKEKIYENRLIVIAKPKQYKYEFNLEWFKLQLKDYLESTYSLNSVISFANVVDRKQYFGIACYDLVINYLDSLLQSKEKKRKDWRVFTLLCDHKKLLKMRVEFFREKEIYSINDNEMERYNTLCGLSEIVLTLLLKHIMTGEKKILINLKKTIMNMKEIEINLLHELQNKRN